MSPSPVDSDPDLLRQYRGGDPTAFELLVDRYAQRLRSYLLRQADAQEVDDLLQEVFLRLVRNSRKLARRETIEGWLFSVARNLTLDRRRAARRWRPLTIEDSELELRRGGAGALDPEDALESKLLGERVEEAVASLPEHEREIFLLRHYSKLSFREIAALLGIPVNTALSRMHRGIERLRRALTPTQHYWQAPLVPGGLKNG